ncbi:unnamed protein product [Amoebophrya sp. A120]|nr:unnamed protein product [Amoebophrya sp. A120]|eukprot:GSA120T00024326001.1
MANVFPPVVSSMFDPNAAAPAAQAVANVPLQELPTTTNVYGTALQYVQMLAESPGACCTAAAVTVVVAQALVNLWIWSVWTWRFAQPTSFRGGAADSLLKEFETYGYGPDMMKFVGFVKLGAATLLPLAVMDPGCDYLLFLSSGVLLFLMVVAIVSHFKVNDPISRNFPAGCMAVLSLYALVMGLEKGSSYEAFSFWRVLVGIVLLAADGYMWYDAKYKSKAYATVPASDNVFFKMVE